MTDEEKEKTEKEYKEWLVHDHKLLDNPTYCDIEQKCFRAFFAGTRYGLAEGRKENAELKEQIEKMKCCGNCKHLREKHNENCIFIKSLNTIVCNKWEFAK